ncbi:MAG: hypothetical protein AMJ94_18340 [Deltaproteobacteria bacterium SM23_61]|nr:MAG: hypothetical protein AMJ94_18340 [Deltaproteobacteria bacterium SM23_61]
MRKRGGFAPRSVQDKTLSLKYFMERTDRFSILDDVFPARGKSRPKKSCLSGKTQRCLSRSFKKGRIGEDPLEIRK